MRPGRSRLSRRVVRAAALSRWPGLVVRVAGYWRGRRQLPACAAWLLYQSDRFLPATRRRKPDSLVRRNHLHSAGGRVVGTASGRSARAAALHRVVPRIFGARREGQAGDFARATGLDSLAPPRQQRGLSVLAAAPRPDQTIHRSLLGAGPD